MRAKRKWKWACAALLSLNVFAIAYAEDKAGIDFVVLTAPANKPDKQSQFIRELYRQAFLIAARDELGFATRDSVLGEPAPPQGCSAQFSVEVDGEGMFDPKRKITVTALKSPQNVPALILSLPAMNPDTGYLANLISAAGFSRNEFKSFLLSAGLAAHPHHQPDSSNAEVSEQIQTLLSRMDAIAQFLALRQIYESIEKQGTSPALQGALAQAYANLTMLTEFQWSVMHKAFAARALLYAQRLCDADSKSAFALWQRMYSFSLIGMQNYARTDFEVAEKLAKATGEKAPAWHPMLTKFLGYERRAVEDAAYPQNVKMLADFLIFRMAEAEVCGEIAQTLLVNCGNRTLAANPACFPVYSALSNEGDLSTRHKTTEAGLASFLQALPLYLQSAPHVPPDVRKSVGSFLSSASAESFVPIIDSLIKSGESKAGVLEPSWAILGKIAREHVFRLVYDRVNFMSNVWGVDPSDYLEQTHVLVAGHPFQPMLPMLWKGTAKVSDSDQALLLKNVQLADKIPQMFPLYNILVSEEYGARLKREVFAHSDLDARSMELIMAQSDAGERKALVPALQKLNKCHPLFGVTVIGFEWNLASKHAQEWEDKSADHPSILYQLGKQYVAESRIEDARRCFRKSLAISADACVYLDLAKTYELEKDRTQWKAILDEYLKGPDRGLSHADVQVRIATYYCKQKDFKTALPYADAAANTWASWAMHCAAECHEGLEDWAGAELWIRRISERYSGEEMVWYYWCSRTGRGDIKAAAQCALPAADKATWSKDHLSAGAFYLINAKIAEARIHYHAAFDPDLDPFSGMHLVFLEHAARNFTERDKLLEIVISNPRNFSGNVESFIEFGKLLRTAWKDGSELPVDAVEELLICASPAERMNVCYFIGCFYDDRKNQAAASDYFDRAARGRETKNLWLNVLLAINWLNVHGLKIGACQRVPERKIDPPTLSPDSVHLRTDAVFKKEVDTLLAQSAAGFADDGSKIQALRKLASAWSLLRNNENAAACMQEAIALDGKQASLHVDLSVFLGKSGKYDEAIAEARRAVEMNPSDTMHANLVWAEWEWRQGKRQEARSRFESVSCPTNNPTNERLYHGCRAAFFAATGEESKLVDEIDSLLSMDGSEHALQKFVQRDVAFDAYREKPWFVKRMGATILPDDQVDHGYVLKRWQYIGGGLAIAVGLAVLIAIRLSRRKLPRKSNNPLKKI